VIHAYGPIRDLKVSSEKLKALGELLEGEMEKKVLWISPEKSRLVKLLFEGKIDREVEKLRKERFKLVNLLSIAKQRQLSAEIQTLKTLSNLDILDDFTDLSAVNGVLSVPHDESRGRELYPIVHSQVMKPVLVETDKSEARREEIFSKHAHKFEPLAELSELDVLKTNAMLWMITVAVKKKNFDGQFYPMERAKKEITHENGHQSHRSPK
jgi:hypothetical protein